MICSLVVVSLEFRCNGSGEARVDVTIAISNRTHRGYHNDIATHHVFSLTKRCGDCHGNSGESGNYQNVKFDMNVMITIRCYNKH